MCVVTVGSCRRAAVIWLWSGVAVKLTRIYGATASAATVVDWGSPASPGSKFEARGRVAASACSTAAYPLPGPGLAALPCSSTGGIPAGVGQGSAGSPGSPPAASRAPRHLNRTAGAAAFRQALGVEGRPPASSAYTGTRHTREREHATTVGLSVGGRESPYHPAIWHATGTSLAMARFSSAGPPGAASARSDD